jgi:hypothetical protein
LNTRLFGTAEHAVDIGRMLIVLLEQVRVRSCAFLERTVLAYSQL